MRTERVGARRAHRSRTLAVALAFAAASTTSGCATAEGATVRTAPATAGTAEPIGLVGLWDVSDADGEREGTRLRLGGGELELLRECGTLGGWWRAGERAVIAHVDSASGDCVTSSSHEVGWLDAMAAYRAIDDGWQLLDADGQVVASLTAAPAPETNDPQTGSFAAAPVSEETAHVLFTDPPPLPAALTPASSGDLIGRWEPVGISAPTEPHVVFLASGTWDGSDGCNSLHGRWIFEDDGDLLTTAGGSTDAGCEGSLAPYWVMGARLAGFDGDELVLLDDAGGELGRLVRADP